MSENETGSQQLRPEDVPVLEGWVLLTDLATSLKISRQGLHQKIFPFRAMSLVGPDEMRQVGEGTRRIYLVRQDAAERVIASRRARISTEDASTTGSDA